MAEGHFDSWAKGGKHGKASALDIKNHKYDHDWPYGGVGLFNSRRPQTHSLTDCRIISSDNHICFGGEDFFYENAPASLKERAPRIKYVKEKGLWEFSIDGKLPYPLGSEDLIASMETVDGAWNIDERVRHMDAEGIDVEVAFPQVLGVLFSSKDFERKEYVMSEYNRYLARLQRRAPGRFYGVGVPNYWEPAQTAASLKELMGEGIKVIMLPCKPGTFPDGEEIEYSSPRMRPFWQAIVDADITVCYHIGEVPSFNGKGAYATGCLNALSAADFRQIWGRLAFGGVFDDFPKLRVVFTEANLTWVASMLQDADMLLACHGQLMDYLPKLKMSDYWHRNCYATFFHDPAGLRLLDKIGMSNVMWSQDYPHNESSFGHTGESIQSVVKAVGEQNARMICSTTAAACFKI